MQMKLKPEHSAVAKRYGGSAAGVVVLLLAACCALAAQSQGTSALDCLVDNSDRTQAIIRLTEDAPKGLQLSDLSGKNWTLYGISDGANKAATQLTIDHAEVKTEKYQPIAAGQKEITDTYLAVLFVSPLPPNINSIQGIVATKTAVISISKCQLSSANPKPQAPLVAATGKTDSDIYFNGSYTATAGGNPVYSIDSFAGYMHAVPSEIHPWGELGAYGQITTKAGSTSPSPNSYLVYAVFERVLASNNSSTRAWIGPFQRPIFDYRLAGGEFDQQGTNLNFVNSPMLTFPFRLTTGTLGEIHPGVTVPHMTIIAGAEFVHPVSSALPEAGWITRGLVGATFSTGYAPKKAGFDSVVFSTSYQLRLPSSPEVYYNARYAVTNEKTGQKVTPPKLGTQPRPYVDSKLTYNFQKWVGTTFEYSYGSLPPDFVLKQSTFALGLTFTLQQSSYGRYSILKP